MIIRRSGTYLKGRCARFVRDRDGAATIEWVFLAALTVGLALPVLALVESGSGQTSTSMMETIEAEESQGGLYAARTDSLALPGTPATRETSVAMPKPGPDDRSDLMPPPGAPTRFQSRQGEIAWGAGPSRYGPGVSGPHAAMVGGRAPSNPAGRSRAKNRATSRENARRGRSAYTIVARGADGGSSAL